MLPFYLFSKSVLAILSVLIPRDFVALVVFVSDPFNPSIIQTQKYPRTNLKIVQDPSEENCRTRQKRLKKNFNALKNLFLDVKTQNGIDVYSLQINWDILSFNWF